MQDDWEWFRFVKSIHLGKFADTLQLAAQSIQSDVHVRLAMGVANDPDSFDPDAPTFPRTVRTFLWEPAARSLRLTHSEGSEELAPGVRKARSLQELLDEVAAAENRAWLWVNFLAAVGLQPTSDAGVVSEQHIWTNFLSCFRPWVGAA
jgi:hypothetical protein